MSCSELFQKDESSDQKGVDIWMIRDNLQLSYEERITQYQNTIDFIEELRKVRLNHRAKPAKASKIFNLTTC